MDGEVLFFLVMEYIQCTEHYAGMTVGLQNFAVLLFWIIIVKHFIVTTIFQIKVEYGTIKSSAIFFTRCVCMYVMKRATYC